jgi:hypothetical protein
MANNERIKELERERRAQKDILDTILSQAKSDEERLKIKKGQIDVLSTQGKTYKEHLDILTEINSQVKDIQSENKILVDDLIAQESKLKGLTGLEASLVGLNKQRLQLQQDLGSEAQSAINSIAAMNQELLTMSAEDSIARHQQNDLIEQQLLDLFDTGEISYEILENLQRQREVAFSISRMTEKQQKFLNKQLEVYEGIRDTLGGILETASIITSGVGGAIGTSLIFLGPVVGKLGEDIRKLGGGLNSATLSASGLSYIFPNAVDNLEEMSKELGGIEELTFGTQLSAASMATNYGISGTELAKMTSSLMRISGGSKEQAFALMQSTGEYAKQQGIVKKVAMQDLAENAEYFAMYSGEATKSLMSSVIQARKLGVSFQALSGMADGLLDFETSITKELELGALLGKQVNFNLARQYALSGELGKMTKEIVNQIGGEAAWSKMNRIERQMVAESVGKTVDEMDKMVKNMDKMNDQGEIQVSGFEKLNELVESASTGVLGKLLPAVGSLVLAWGQSTIMSNAFEKSISKIGKSVEVAKEATEDIGKNIVEKGKEQVEAAVDNQLDNLKSKMIPGGDGEVPQIEDVGKSVSKLPPPTTLLAAGAALLMLAGAIFIMAKAVQEFAKIDTDKMGASIVFLAVALGGMVLALWALSTVSLAAPALYAVAVVIGMIGLSILAMGAGISLATNGIANLVTAIGGLGSEGAKSLLAFGGAMLFLAGAVALLAKAGWMALPIIGALAGLGFIINHVIDGKSKPVGDTKKTELSEYHSTMLSKMDELITAVRENRDVYIDKEKVTAAIKVKMESVRQNTAGAGISKQY